MDDQIAPVQVGDYVITKILSKKARSFVYQGMHQETQELFAIKMSAHSVENTVAVHTFLREAHVLSQISHPNIIKFYHQGMHQDRPYLVLEHVFGISLREYILSQITSLPCAIDIAIAITQALDCLHQKGILHKDLKPDNLLITPNRVVKLIDFGLSTFRTGSYIGYRGTPSYMSPEQQQGEPISERSEMYSLGLILYELLTGHLACGRIFLSLVPEGMSKILAKALHPSPQGRYASVHEFYLALCAYRDGEMHKEIRDKDKTAMVIEEMNQQRRWLSPSEIISPDFISVSICEQKTAFPSVYYESQMVGDRFRLWLCYVPSGQGVFALTSIKNWIYQWGGEEDTQQTVRKIHEALIRMAVPIGHSGVSLVCLSIPRGRKELSWIACGKTTFWLKRRGKDSRSYETSFTGLGKISSLQIRETNVAWEIGDRVLLQTVYEESTTAASCCPLFTELKDRGQTDIFCPTESTGSGIKEEHTGNHCPSTLISIRRIR